MFIQYTIFLFIAAAAAADDDDDNLKLLLFAFQICDASGIRETRALTHQAKPLNMS